MVDSKTSRHSFDDYRANERTRMNSVYRLFYVSKAVKDLDDSSVQSILRTSRRNNDRLDVTGCLLVSGHYFAQVLEGRMEVVSALVTRIAKDPRHSDTKTLLADSFELRDFGGWSMGYLHNLRMEDDLAGLFTDVFTDPELLSETLDRMRPDTVMGALQ